MFGYIPSPPDKRDYRINRMPLASSGLFVFPFSWVIPGINNIPVLDQGKRPTCVAHSTATLKMWQDYQERDRVEAFSREYMYGMCKSLDGIPAEPGTYPRIAMHILVKNGICAESLCPYEDKAPIPYFMTNFSEREHADASRNKSLNYARIDNDLEMKGALMAYGPVLIGVPVYKNWFDAKINATGCIPTPIGEPIAGHAMVVIGWDRDQFIVRNSWGSDWGIKGNGRLSGNYPGLFEDAWFSIDIIIPKGG